MQVYSEGLVVAIFEGLNSTWQVDKVVSVLVKSLKPNVLIVCFVAKIANLKTAVIIFVNYC